MSTIHVVGGWILAVWATACGPGSAEDHGAPRDGAGETSDDVSVVDAADADGAPPDARVRNLCEWRYVGSPIGASCFHGECFLASGSPSDARPPDIVRCIPTSEKPNCGDLYCPPGVLGEAFPWKCEDAIAGICVTDKPP